MDWSRLREPWAGIATRPTSIDACTDATTSRAPSLLDDDGRGTRSPRGSCGRCRRASTANGNGAGASAFSTRCSTTHRVLAAGEQHDRVAQLGRHLADDEDRRGPRARRGGRAQARARWWGSLGERQRCNPHSVLDEPAQRPDLGSSPAARRAGCTASSRSTGSRRTSSGFTGTSCSAMYGVDLSSSVHVASGLTFTRPRGRAPRSVWSRRVCALGAPQPAHPRRPAARCRASGSTLRAWQQASVSVRHRSSGSRSGRRTRSRTG